MKSIVQTFKYALTCMLTLSLLACAAPMGQAPTSNKQVDKVLAERNPSMALSVVLANSQVVVGDILDMRVASQAPGYLYLFSVSNQGQSISLLFPNDQDYDNRIGSAELRIPRPHWRMRSVGPAGTTHLVAVVASQGQDIRRLGYLASMAKIEINGSYGATSVPLTERTLR